MNTTRADLKALTDDELAALMATAGEATVTAIIREIGRRERVAATKARDAARWAATYAAWHDAAYAQFLAAEAETKGYMLSRAGVAAGIDPFDLWSGPASKVAKYASEELRNYLLGNERLTISEYHRQDRANRRDERLAYEGE
jgi:hypothetical protein